MDIWGYVKIYNIIWTFIEEMHRRRLVWRFYPTTPWTTYGVDRIHLGGRVATIGLETAQREVATLTGHKPVKEEKEENDKVPSPLVKVEPKVELEPDFDKYYELFKNHGMTDGEALDHSSVIKLVNWAISSLLDILGMSPSAEYMHIEEKS